MPNATLPADLVSQALPGRLDFEESALGGPVARLTHGGFQALVALHGAQVLNWTHDGRGLLWLSPIARIRDGKGIRGGIPVCWPWFADHPTDPNKPAHGFVRHRAWSVVATHATSDGVSLSLATATTDGDREMWPHSAEALVTVTLGEALTVALKTRNTGPNPFPLTEALHTYFRVSDIMNVSVTGLEGRVYLDKLDRFARKSQAGPILVAEEVDRIYLGDTSRIVLHDSGSERVLVIEGSGSASAVVWNPWTAKTARLGDMGSPDAFRQMICIETANAGDDIVTIGPGETHTLGVTYRLAP
ncbi:MAG: D-hexose-6-phosphate mutarotase [Hyphomicrobiaceae bacterium]